MSDNIEVKFNKEISDAFTTINNSLTLFKMQFNTLQQQVRTLEKNVKKELKSVKKIAKPPVPKAKKAPSGFAKPSPISKELCIFMKLPENSEVPRTEATQYIIKYIAEHKLQHVENRKIIVPNTELKSLLSLSDETTLTYFNIQKYMNNHFEKK